MQFRKTSTIVGTLAIGTFLGFWLKTVFADGIPSPNPLYYSGTLTEGGTLVNGTRAITVNLWPDGTAQGTPLCSTVVSSPPANVVSGRFRIALTSACKGAINANPNAYVEVIDGATSLGRAPIGAVPYAVEADHAVSATNATNATTASYAADAGHASSADNATHASNVPLLTAWQSYTPVMETTAQVAVAAASSTGQYRRVGDSAEVVIHTTFQSTPSTGTPWYHWTLPTGLAIDMSKLSESAPGAVVGGGAVGQGLNNNIMLVTYVRTGSTVSATTNGGATYYINDSVPIAFGMGGSVDLYFTVPIVGWTITQ